MSRNPKIRKNLKKSIFFNPNILKEKNLGKKNQMLFSQFCHLRRLVFDQSSPVPPVSESRGGGPCLILDTIMHFLNKLLGFVFTLQSRYEAVWANGSLSKCHVDKKALCLIYFLAKIPFHSQIRIFNIGSTM